MFILLEISNLYLFYYKSLGSVFNKNDELAFNSILLLLLLFVFRCSISTVALLLKLLGFVKYFLL